MTRSHGLLFGIGACLALLPQSQAAESQPPFVVAHRGLLRHAPENTLANFRACLELRIGFEFDVQKSKDGVLVCLHDDTLDRTTTGQGRVADHTLSEIRQLDAGSWFDPRFAGEKVPTIDEVLELVAEYRQHDILVAVDLKATDVEAEVVKLAEQHQVLQRLLFIGRTITEPGVRSQLKRTNRAAQTAAVANNPGEFPAILQAPDVDWIYFRYIPSAEEIAQIQRAQKQSFIAGPTVAGHLPTAWQQAAAVGINGILTDYPLELRALFRHEEPRQ
ncbi:hypothetical protein GC163_13565 [bacterium]|nr:hypothetical protein [bacterium]